MVDLMAVDQEYFVVDSERAPSDEVTVCRENFVSLHPISRPKHWLMSILFP